MSSLVELQARISEQAVKALQMRRPERATSISDITPEGELQAVGLDSMAMVNLMLALELEFDIAFDGTEMTPKNFRTIGTIASLVSRKLNG